MGSKLGPHFIGAPGLEKWITAGCSVLKFDPLGLGASAGVPAGPLVVGKLDQQDDAIGLTDWKALMNRSMEPEAAADLRFNAQTSIYAGANRPRVNRYEANPRIDVWEDDNEVAPDNEAEAKWYAQYCIAMMRLYEGIGKKRANFSFAVGTPDMRIWPFLLPAVKYARDHSHYIALHEYMGYEPQYGIGWNQVGPDRKPLRVWHGRHTASGTPDERYPWGWAALRYRFIWDTVFRPSGLADVRLVLTECGCDSVESVTPAGKPVGNWTNLADYWQNDNRYPDEVYAGHLRYYDAYLREDEYVVGATVFTVGSVGIWRNWDIAGTMTEEQILNYIRESAGSPTVPAPEPDPDPLPPDPEPVKEGENMLVNPSFEDGHYDLYNEKGERLPIQVPNGWTFKYDTYPAVANPFEPLVEHSRFGQPECNVLHRSKFPQDEWAQFGLQGEFIFKWFGKAHRGRLLQTVDLPEGEYEIGFSIFADAVMRYDGGKKVWADDPRACMVRLKVNEIIYTLKDLDGPVRIKTSNGVEEIWYYLPIGKLTTLSTRFGWPGGHCKIALHVMMPFALPQNGVFIDSVELVRVSGLILEPNPDPEPEKPADPPSAGLHKAIVLRYPQEDLNDAEWEQLTAYGRDRRRTFTGSHDDALTVVRGGNADSYIELAFPEYPSQQEAAELFTTQGVKVVELFARPKNPMAGVVFGHPFAYRYVVTDRFNAPRTYGNGKHEGIDIDIIGGMTDNKVDVLCLYEGVVDRSLDSPGGYGKYVRIRHAAPSGATFYTRYAHLDKRVVEVGQVIRKGAAVGEVGSTGNANGEHVHINIEVPGHGLSGYVVADVIDPAPYIPSGVALPAYLPPPTAEKVDLLPYLRGDGRAFMVRHPKDGNQEKFRTVTLGNDRWLILKNNQWEELWSDGETIWRGRDTSAGEGNYYSQDEIHSGGARWCPRYMTVGQTWTSPVTHKVQTYRKSDCMPVEHHRNGTSVNRVKLAAKYEKVTWNGITVPDVIALETNTGESMWFARGYGLVAWESPWGISAISQILPAHEADNQPERGCFGP